MKLAADRTINGICAVLFFAVRGAKKLCCVGKSLMIVPPSVSKIGYRDVDKDDIVDDEYFMNNQARQLRIIEDRWAEGWRKDKVPEGATRKAR